MSTALRSNSWGTWRPREGSRNVHNTAIRRALSSSHPCGSVTAGVHGCPRGVTPLRRHIVISDNSVVAHGRSNDPSASHLVRRGPPASPLFASWPWPLNPGRSMQAIDIKYTREFLAGDTVGLAGEYSLFLALEKIIYTYRCFLAS